MHALETINEGTNNSQSMLFFRKNIMTLKTPAETILRDDIVGGRRKRKEKETGKEKKYGRASEGS